MALWSFALTTAIVLTSLIHQNKSTRICFACTGLSEADKCHNVETCRENEVCFTQKFKGVDNITRYDLGCAYPELCRKDRFGIVFGKRNTDHSHVQCHRCCNDTNICNSELSCDDKFTANPTLKCLSCGNVDRPDVCLNETTCEKDEVCFIQKYLTENSQEHFDLGCKHSTMCLNGYMNVLGRRSNELKHLLCESCCSGKSLCNRGLNCSHHDQQTINGSCTSTNGCQSNLVCEQGKCQCSSSSYFWADNKCNQRKQVYKHCTETSECSSQFRCLNNHCSCPESTYWNGSQCASRKTFKAECKTSEECTDSLFCIYNVCDCARTDFWTGSNCSRRKNFKTECKTSEECKDSLFCINNLCDCTMKYVWTGYNCSIPPLECSQVDFSTDGIQFIFPDGKNRVLAYCVIRNNTKWTVMQRRFDGSVDFYRTWSEYKNGFGNVSGEYWLGNDNIHLISIHGHHKLRVELVLKNNSNYYAEYATISLGDEISNYRLTVTGYSGTAGDSLTDVGIIGRANGQIFSTKDRDHSSYLNHCPNDNEGGWWYNYCEYGDLNRKFSSGMDWRFNTGTNYVKESIMMITKVV